MSPDVPRHAFYQWISPCASKASNLAALANCSRGLHQTYAAALSSLRAHLLRHSKLALEKSSKTLRLSDDTILMWHALFLRDAPRSPAWNATSTIFGGVPHSKLAVIGSSESNDAEDTSHTVLDAAPTAET